MACAIKAGDIVEIPTVTGQKFLVIPFQDQLFLRSIDDPSNGVCISLAEGERYGIIRVPQEGLDG